MAARRSRTNPDQDVPSLALLERHVALSKILYRQTGQLDGFAPRKFIRYSRKQNKQIFRILEVPEVIAQYRNIPALYNFEVIQTRNQYMSKKLSLPEPFPSSPQRPPKYGIKFIRGREVIAHLNFCELYAGHRLLTEILEDTTYKWESDNEIEADLQHLLIRGEQKDLLTILMEYEPTQTERAWELPFPYPMMIKNIRNNYYVPPVTHFADTLPDGKRKEPVQLEIDLPQRSTIERPKKTRQPRPERPTNGTSIADIAKSLNVEPSHARAALRKAAITKPDAGWIWTDPKEIDKITAIVAKAK